jgi:aminoglycoside N3'-acetyltransferase
MRKGAKRTPTNLFFRSPGRRADEFAATEDVEAYGPNSAFALFHKTNGTIVSIGLDFNNTFSMHHYIEYNVGCDYREIKQFSGIYVGYNRIPQLKTYTMFAEEQVKHIVPNERTAAAGDQRDWWGEGTRGAVILTTCRDHPGASEAAFIRAEY